MAKIPFSQWNFLPTVLPGTFQRNGAACISLPFFGLEATKSHYGLGFVGLSTLFTSEGNLEAVIVTVFQYLTFQAEVSLIPGSLNVRALLS